MSRVSIKQVEELADFLDRQSEHLERMLGYLDELRKALIRRDLPVLQEMQAQLAREAEIRVQLDQSVQVLQRTLGESLGCRPQAICLTAICRAGGESVERVIRPRQRHLAEQVLRLRQQHLATELLMREYARMNRRLLEALAGRDEKGTIYDSRGRSSRHTQAGLMSVKL